MGMRLEGAPLAHRTPAAADIVSDGVTPGAIQVPGNGQPIILLADCQTVGGYPKIATVISADLPRLAQARPGQAIRFRAVDAVEARAGLAGAGHALEVVGVRHRLRHAGRGGEHGLAGRLAAVSGRLVPG